MYLSTEVLAKETHEQATAYFRIAEQYGYKFIMEVKKIREERMYKELGFTSFDDYCESAWNTKRDSMDERIKIASEFGENFDGTYRQLGHSKSLLLARMEPEVRQEIVTRQQIIPSTGQVKNHTEMTVNELKELQEVKAELKLKEEELNREQVLNQELVDTINSKEQNEPIVSNVLPESVISEISNLKSKLQQEETESKLLEDKLLKLALEKEDFEKKLKDVESYQKSEQYEIDRLRIEKDKLELKAHISINGLQINIHKFIQDNSANLFLQGAVASSGFMMKDDLLDSVIALEEFTQKLREILDTKIEDRFRFDKNRIIDIN